MSWRGFPETPVDPRPVPAGDPAPRRRALTAVSEDRALTTAADANCFRRLRKAPILAKQTTGGDLVSIVFLIVVGAAAGLLATRLMRLDIGLPATVALGVAGALIGGIVLRFLLLVTGWLAGFLAAVGGALLLIWLWKTYAGR
jgi:uncharacterized membrane protein YeaQ/YmgE (transglycosylase-associated protein family)